VVPQRAAPPPGTTPPRPRGAPAARGARGGGDPSVRGRGGATGPPRGREREKKRAAQLIPARRGPQATHGTYRRGSWTGPDDALAGKKRAAPPIPARRRPQATHGIYMERRDSGERRGRVEGTQVLAHPNESYPEQLRTMRRCHRAGEPLLAIERAVKGERRGKTQKRSTFGAAARRRRIGHRAPKVARRTADRSGPVPAWAEPTTESHRVGSRQTRRRPRNGVQAPGPIAPSTEVPAPRSGRCIQMA
jgi:hypothetical protein